MLFDLITKNKTISNLTLKHWLLISCGFSCSLSVVRVIATGYYTYLFMGWNLFLAFVPYFITERFSHSIPLMEHKWKRILIVAVWLLFIPNSFYIITDLFHLDQFDAAPKWFDLLLLFSYAWNGLVLGLLSVRKMAIIQQSIMGQRFAFLFIFIVMWLNAFGVYIGRFLRFNSWNIITNPFSLFAEVMEMIFYPLQNKMEWSMITTWAIFMTLFYFTIEKITEHKLSK